MMAMGDDTGSPATAVGLENKRKVQLKSAVTLLALELELHEGRRFSVNKGVDEVIKVLKFSSSSQEPTVVEKLKKVITFLTPEQKQFFESKGILLNVSDLDGRFNQQKYQARQNVLYSGKSQASDAAPTPSPDDVSATEKPKKKIMYRGCEQWV